MTPSASKAFVTLKVDPGVVEVMDARAELADTSLASCRGSGAAGNLGAVHVRLRRIVRRLTQVMPNRIAVGKFDTGPAWRCRSAAYQVGAVDRRRRSTDSSHQVGDEIVALPLVTIESIGCCELEIARDPCRRRRCRRC